MGSTDGISIEKKLTNFIGQRRRTAFKWGSFDCALFAADWVKEVKGFDYAESFRGKYDSRKTANKELKARGYRLDEYIDTLFEASCCSKLAKGDLVLHGCETSIGICSGIYSWFVTMDGLTPVLTIDCCYGWKIDKPKS